MNENKLNEQRRWFSTFPEGTLEFLVVTRVFAVLFLMALAIVGGSQRPLVVGALLVVLWIDYVMLLWWLIQVGSGLRALARRDEPQVARDDRVSTFMRAVLPSIWAVLVLGPWPSFLRFLGLNEGAIIGTPLGLAVAVVVFVVLVMAARPALKSLELGPALWTSLLLVPVVHWWALHRLGGQTSRRMWALARQMSISKLPPSGLALVVADVMWVLTLLPWACVVAISLWQGWPGSRLFTLLPICGTIIGALFAIANLAAMEGVQRQFVALIRKAPST